MLFLAATHLNNKDKKL